MQGSFAAGKEWFKPQNSMFGNLKTHPFPVSAHFDFSLVLTYALPQETLQPLLPPHLEPDGFGNQGFVAVAMVQTRHLRPSIFPAFMGQSFFLIGYRIFVKYHTTGGKRLRGLYILRSETNRPLMKTMGNVFTHYNYSVTDIAYQQEEKAIRVSSQQSGFEVAVNWKSENVALPPGSPFTDWKQARRFAGPLPFTFDYEKTTGSMMIVQGVRQHWEPHPVAVERVNVAFFDHAPFAQTKPVLANAFVVENIPYRWEKGRRETKTALAGK